MSECEKDLRRASKEIENEFPAVAQVCREAANFVGMVIKQSKSDAGIADTLRARVQELETQRDTILRYCEASDDGCHGTLTTTFIRSIYNPPEDSTAGGSDNA